MSYDLGGSIIICSQASRWIYPAIRAMREVEIQPQPQQLLHVATKSIVRHGLNTESSAPSMCCAGISSTSDSLDSAITIPPEPFHTSSLKPCCAAGTSRCASRCANPKRQYFLVRRSTRCQLPPDNTLPRLLLSTSASRRLTKRRRYITEHQCVGDIQRQRVEQQRAVIWLGQG